MKKRKFLVTLLTALVMMLSSTILCFAENTDDYTFKPEDAFDFCVYNIWAQNFIPEPFQDITNIQMVVEVTDFSGDPIDIKLYSREQKTWLTWASEPQSLNGDGTYTFVVDMGAENIFTPAELATIYLKDIRCCTTDEDPDGKELAESGISCHMKLVSVDFNVDTSAAAPETSEELTEASEEESSVEATEATEQTTTEAAKSESKSDKKSGAPIAIIVVVVVVVVAAGVVVAKKKKN